MNPTAIFFLLCLFCSGLTLTAQQSPVRNDTVPGTRDRYAKELEELTRMKEKFRQEQERRIQQRERGGTIDPLSPPTIAERPATPKLDSTSLRSGVRSGLYPDQRPHAYEQRRWESTLDNGLPAGEQLSAAERTRPDSTYTEQMREVATVGASASMTTKGAPSTPTAGPTFIPNTAYPDGEGYDALDRLVETVMQAATVVEIRVHTARSLDRRVAQLLSEERAATIRNYLIEAGIADENFQVIGYGNHESAAGERVEVITTR